MANSATVYFKCPDDEGDPIAVDVEEIIRPESDKVIDPTEADIGLLVREAYSIVAEAPTFDHINDYQLGKLVVSEVDPEGPRMTQRKNVIWVSEVGRHAVHRWKFVVDEADEVAMCDEFEQDFETHSLYIEDIPEYVSELVEGQGYEIVQG